MATNLQRITGRYFAAQQFLTRLPCPRWTPHAASDLSASLAWFPLVGLVVGASGAGVLALVRGALGEPPVVAAVLAVGVCAVVTGAFHEDALADVCDAFGGMTPERRREIMRDSRVGSFGATGVALLIAAKVGALSSVPWRVGAAALVTAHVVARWTALPLTSRRRHVEDPASLAKPYAAAATPARFAMATLVPTLPLTVALLGPTVAVGLLVGVLVLCALAGRFFVRWIGGLTGDCLGCVNQLAEVLTYACFAHGPVARAVLERVT